MNPINNPQEIEAKSFAIIEGFLKNASFPTEEKAVVKRVIHTTTDTRYVKDLLFSEDAVTSGIKAVQDGARIIVDAGMVKAGINKKLSARFGNNIICKMHQRAVIREASQSASTRATVAMRKSASSMAGGIVAIGNAPTALFAVCDLIEKNKARPALIVGIPVGFVGAMEAKRRLRGLKIPYITNRSRRGGSAVAAAIVNALLILAAKGRPEKNEEEI